MARRRLSTGVCGERPRTALRRPLILGAFYGVPETWAKMDGQPGLFTKTLCGAAIEPALRKLQPGGLDQKPVSNPGQGSSGRGRFGRLLQGFPEDRRLARRRGMCAGREDR